MLCFEFQAFIESFKQFVRSPRYAVFIMLNIVKPSQRVGTLVHRTGLAFALAALLSVALGFSMSVYAATAAVASDSGQYRSDQPVVQLGVGDSVGIQVYGQPDMSVTVYVADDGTLSVPLTGPVKVTGLSPTDAAHRIEKALRDGGFLVDPHVTLTVSQSLSQKISVLGEVKQPGRYPISGNTSIFDVIAQAGGVSDNSSSLIYILRQNNSGGTDRIPVNLKGLATENGVLPEQVLRGGDSVVVPRAEQCFISGEVKNPGMYKIEPGMTVEEAIIRAGGITDRGSRSRVDVKRTDPNGKPKNRHADLNETVQSGDVIHVKESIF